MSTTITTNKQAAAFRKSDGQVIYLISEQTYESNVYPHTPRWSVTAFGTRNDVLRRIFQHARSCEGGMLASRAGSIRPENYIETWKQHLAKPFELHDQNFKLSIGDCYRSPIPLPCVDEIRTLMETRGYGAQFAQIEAGSLVVSLFADIDLLLLLFGQEAPLSPWRAFDGELRCSSQILAVEPVRNVKAERLPRVRAYRLDAHEVVVSINGAPLRLDGWEYNSVGNFIDVVYERELVSPGWGKTALPWYRELLRDAPTLPGDTHVFIQRDLEDEKQHGWRVETVNRVAVAAGVADENGQAPIAFGFELHLLGDDEQRLYDLRSIPKQQVFFDVPVEPVNASAQATDAEQGKVADWEHDLQLGLELI